MCLHNPVAWVYITPVHQTTHKMNHTIIHPSVNPTSDEIAAKTRSELATIKVKGFISLYKTVINLIKNGYILDPLTTLEYKLNYIVDILNTCDADALVPEHLHEICIAVDIAVEDALEVK